MSFEDFYSKYPRKVSRGAAVKAYDKAVKTTDHEAIMDGLGRYLSHLEEHPKEAKFIKHASTWLNQQCWLDELGPTFNDSLEASAVALSLRDRYMKDPEYWGRVYSDSVLQALNLGPYAKGAG